MNCDQCTKVSEKQAVCFDRMADGHALTDWRPTCSILNQQVQGTSSYQQRMYLINNAEALMQKNRDALPSTLCEPCFMPNENGTMLPEQRVQQCNDKSCTFVPVDNGGLGMGRNYAIAK